MANPLHREHRRVGLIAGWENLDRRLAQAEVARLRWAKLWRDEWRLEVKGLRPPALSANGP